MVGFIEFEELSEDQELIEDQLGFTTGEPIWNKIELYSMVIVDDLEYHFPDGSVWE